tara:strand:+ start:167 stop:694 length:528 start_codon:yes stop_codon:yes gene_type:complete
MKYFVNFVVLIFVVFLCNSSAKSNEKFAYIDIDKIMRQSKAGKSINKQLESLLSQTTKKYKEIENNLKEDELKITSQKNILDENEYKKKIIELKKKANEYRNERNKDINSFNKKKIEATNKLLNTINPILIEYSNKNSISMIFQKKNIIIGKSELDITDEILKIVDSKINKIKIN